MPAHLLYASDICPDEPGDYALSLPGYDELANLRRRVGTVTIVAVMASYLGFFALVAFAPTWLGTLVPGWGSIAFIAMLVMYAIAWTITGLYLRHVGRRLAPLEKRVRAALLAKLDNAPFEDPSK
ncbi:hypothetical protein DR64_420 [Paraburkholderia xenovorans LB400]|jgi:uncharacterized membrane protein (DUF485 family)|uniref:Transmembrane protein n=1 Tax=Paraburkholderia xenovorans (strain LB400) TaxID=266265 RepID=Q140L2_PARXL|nr:DUF485 domain-containing protein [Paraburkholderia xenovorans]ABE30227.1 Predicted protein of unknown function, DUF485 [Paraburkholderia xenovorans LB400]AIP31145.1 hypothetical protein DR64_420 [Paraburkholderia xenovorans LB400]